MMWNEVVIPALVNAAVGTLGATIALIIFRIIMRSW